MDLKVNQVMKAVIDNSIIPKMIEELEFYKKELEFYKMAYNNAQILMEKSIIDWYRHGICKKCFALSKFCCGYCNMTVCACNEHNIECKTCNDKFCPSYHHKCDNIG